MSSLAGFFATTWSESKMNSFHIMSIVMSVHEIRSGIRGWLGEGMSATYLYSRREAVSVTFLPSSGRGRDAQMKMKSPQLLFS